MYQLGTALFLLLSLAAIVRTLRIMRLGNALQLSALLFKVVLNFLGAALMVVAGSELPTAYRALALTLVFLQFLNPVALTIYFTPPKASQLPMALSIVFAGIMMPLLLWYGLIDLGWLQRYDALLAAQPKERKKPCSPSADSTATRRTMRRESNISYFLVSNRIFPEIDW